MTITGDQLVLLLNTVVAVFLPALVGLVTKDVTHPGLKSIILLVLSVVNVLVGQIIVAVHTGNFDWFTWVLGAIASFVIGVATQRGFWKPTGISARLTAIGS